MSGHVFIEGEEVKEQVDNKGRSLISCDALAASTMDHGPALVCAFEIELNFHGASLFFLGIATWLFRLLKGVSFAEQICYWGSGCVAKALLRLRCLRVLHVMLVLPFLHSFTHQAWHHLFS
jgi:hypothetical protein